MRKEIDSPSFKLDLNGTTAILGKSFEPWEISIFNLASIVKERKTKKRRKYFIKLILWLKN